MGSYYSQYFFLSWYTGKYLQRGLVQGGITGLRDLWLSWCGLWELVFTLSLHLVKPLVALRSSLRGCNVWYICCLIFAIYSGSAPTTSWPFSVPVPSAGANRVWCIYSLVEEALLSTGIENIITEVGQTGLCLDWQVFLPYDVSVCALPSRSWHASVVRATLTPVRVCIIPGLGACVLQPQRWDARMEHTQYTLEKCIILNT